MSLQEDTRIALFEQPSAQEDSIAAPAREQFEAGAKARLGELEEVIERGLETFLEVGQALREIRDERLYREQGFSAFDEYVRERWGMERGHAYRLADYAMVVEAVSPTGDIPEPANERQARELAPLAREDPGAARAAYEVAVKDAEARGVDLTARDVEQAVRGVVKRKEKEENKRLREAERAEAAHAMAEVAYDERIRLLHADFSDALADEEHVQADSVDLVLCDPPYPRKYLPLYSDLGRLAARVLKPGCALAAMVGQRHLPEVCARLGEHLDYHWTLAYLTPGGQSPQLASLRVNAFWKPVVVFSKGPYSGRFFGDVAKSEVNGNDKNHHHWGQSEAGMLDLLERLSEPGDLVVDPFLGGGTTAVVAAASGRRFFGCDIEEAEVETTRGRLRELGQAETRRLIEEAS